MKVIAKYFLLITICTLCMRSSDLTGQKFHFGASTGLIGSQMDGDRLRGFNKYGYQAGLLGGYSIDEHSWAVVELRYALFGSAKKNERVPVRIEATLRSLDVLLAYSLRFGDTWEGQQKFRVLAGPRLHRIINVDSRNIQKSDVKTSYISAHLGVSHLLSRSFLLDITYTQGLSNILSQEIEGFNKIVPYYLSLGVSYYLNR